MVGALMLDMAAVALMEYKRTSYIHKHYYIQESSLTIAWMLTLQSD